MRCHHEGLCEGMQEFCTPHEYGPEKEAEGERSLVFAKLLSEEQQVVEADGETEDCWHEHGQSTGVQHNPTKSIHIEVYYNVQCAGKEN